MHGRTRKTPKLWQREEILSEGVIKHSLQNLVNSQKDFDHQKRTLNSLQKKFPRGWLKDKYGVSWQIVSTALGELLSGPDPAEWQRVMEAMLQM